MKTQGKMTRLNEILGFYVSKGPVFQKYLTVVSVNLQLGRMHKIF